VPLGVGKQQPAGLGNADAVPDGGQHVLQRLASRDVVVHVAGSDQGHPGSVGQVPEHFQPPLVIRPALEFGDQVTAIREDLAVAPEGCLRYVVRPLRDSFPVADQHARQQPFSVFGDILPSEFTLAFRRLATASRDQPAQAAVSSPVRVELLFERFISKERDEAPDIDVDFEHQRREEVLQYLYQKYGRERAGLAAAVITYRTRSAIREVGKALGLSLDCIDRLAKNMDGYPQEAIELEQRCQEMGIDTTSEVGRRLVHLTKELIGFPRHLSQHVGGMIMTRGPLCELVPIENAAMADRTVVEFGRHPGRRHAGLRHDLPGGHDGRIPD
jgi:hypothetical protein